MRKLLLFADYPDQVLWDRSEDGRAVTPESIGLSGETCRLLWEWYRVWSQIWMVDEGDKTTEKVDWALYDRQGVDVWKRLRRELSGRYRVIFYSHTFEENFEDPEALEKLLINAPIA